MWPAIPGVIGIYTLPCHLPCPAWLFLSCHRAGISGECDTSPSTSDGSESCFLDSLWHFIFPQGLFSAVRPALVVRREGVVVKHRQRTYFTTCMRFCSADRLRCSAFCRCKFRRTRRPDKEFKMARVSRNERTSSKSHQAVCNSWVNAD